MKNVVKRTGVAAVIGSVLVLAGCQSSKVMDNRPYVPAATGDDLSAPTQPAAAQPEVKDLPMEPAPAAQTAVPEQPAFPRFDEAGYEPLKPAAKSAAKGGTYVVKKGDTVSKIAFAHGVRTTDVMALNKLDEKKARRLYVGQKLVIPAGGKAVKSAGAGKAVKSGKTAKNKKAAAAATAAAASDAGVYVVKKGDSIPKIARKLHVKSADLMAANNLDEAATRRLRVGQKLVVPGKGAAPAAKSAEPAAKPAEPAAAPETQAAPAAQPAAPTAQPEVPAGNAPEEAAPASDKVDDSAIPSSRIDNVKADITVRNYLKEKGITIDEFRKLNANAFSGFTKKGGEVLDDVIPAGSTLFIPAPAAEPAP